MADDRNENLRKGTYVPTPAELASIDRGLHDAANRRFATQAQVEIALAKLRGA